MSDRVESLREVLNRPIDGTYPLPSGESEEDWRGRCLLAVEELAERGVFEERDHRETSVGERLRALITEPLPPSLEEKPGRVHLVGELVRNIARPGRINQGLMGTCAVTCLESYLADRLPAEYTAILAGLMSDGGEVELRRDHGVLERNEDLLRWSWREGRRSPVSRIFQVSTMAYAYPDRVYRNTFDGFVPPEDAEARPSRPPERVLSGIDIESFDRLLEGLTGEQWDTLSEKHSRMALMLAEWGLDTSNAPTLRRDGLEIIRRSARAGEPTFVTLDTTDHPRASRPPGSLSFLDLPHKVRVLSVDLSADRITYEDPLDPPEPWLDGVETRIEDHEGRCSMKLADFDQRMLEVSYKPRFWQYGLAQE